RSAVPALSRRRTDCHRAISDRRLGQHQRRASTKPARARHARGAVRAERREAAEEIKLEPLTDAFLARNFEFTCLECADQLTAKSVYWRTSAGWNPRTMSSRGMPAATSSSATGREVPSY